jgi:hypothetical protein
MENPQAVRNEDERAGTKVDLETWKKTVFEQRWLHARHVETVRSALLGVYAAIVSGCLTTLKDGFYRRSALPLYIFLMVLTVIWFLLCIKLGEIFNAHTHEADKLLPPDITKMLSVFQGHWSRRISIRNLLPIFFGVCFFVLLGLSIWIWRHR